MTNYNVTWSGLTPDFITRLYLYGTPDTPDDLNDRIRPANQAAPTVTVDMASYMAGPGRYALASNAPFVQSFFSNLSKQTLTGTYTAQQLIDGGFAATNDFKIRIKQYNLDPSSADYAARTYVADAGLFTIDPSTKFVFDGQNSKIENLDVRANYDGFGFVGGSWVAATGDTLLLQPTLDPFNIGAVVEIRPVGSGEPIKTTYTQADYQQDVQQMAAWTSNATFAGYLLPAMQSLLTIMSDDGVYNYSYEGKQIVYADHRAGAVVDAPNDPLQGGILVGSHSADTLNAGPNTDWLLAGEGDDLLNASPGPAGGGDVLDGGAGKDRLVYGTAQGLITLDTGSSADIPSELPGGGAVFRVGSGASPTTNDYVENVEEIDFSQPKVNLALTQGFVDSTFAPLIDGQEMRLDFSSLAAALNFDQGTVNSAAPGAGFLGEAELLGTNNGDTIDARNTNLTYVQDGSGDDSIYAGSKQAVDAGLGSNTISLAGSTGDTVIFSGGNDTIDGADATDNFYIKACAITGNSSDQAGVAFSGVFADLYSGRPGGQVVSQGYRYTDSSSHDDDPPTYFYNYDFPSVLDTSAASTPFDMIVGLHIDKQNKAQLSFFRIDPAGRTHALPGTVTITNFTDGDLGLHTYNPTYPRNEGHTPSPNQGVIDAYNQTVSNIFGGGVFQNDHIFHKPA